MKRTELDKAHGEVKLRLAATRLRATAARTLHDAATLTGDTQAEHDNRLHLHALLDAELDECAELMRLTRLLATTRE